MSSGGGSMTTTDMVYRILRGASGYLSGEKVSQELGLSRSGVNNCVQRLRQEGFHILSATNRGYRLLEDTDLLNSRELLWYLGEPRMQSVYCYDSIDSTNEVGEAIKKAREAQKKAAKKPVVKKSTTTAKRRADGRLDQRTKEGKEAAARMAKARKAQKSLKNRIKKLFK